MKTPPARLWVGAWATETSGIARLASIFAVERASHGSGPQGSRLITVDGTAYRWRLRGRSTYLQGLAWAPCTFAVEHGNPQPSAGNSSEYQRAHADHRAHERKPHRYAP